MKKHADQKASEAQFGTKLPVSLIRQIKKYALDRDLKVKEVVREAIQEILKK